MTSGLQYILSQINDDIQSDVALYLLGIRIQVCLRFVIVVFPDHTHLLFVIVHRPIINSKRKICIICQVYLSPYTYQHNLNPPIITDTE